ncbi:response regulator [Niallia sp. 01092]|uniref:response regulator n=1 Tax=unclassified Niallia TaxID=2837522 RepID=UPI003FD56297
MTINVLLVDDHNLMLMGLKQLLEKEQDLHIVHTISDPSTLETDILTFHPDVLVMDIKMKAYNGIELTKRMKQTFPELKVVILSGYDYVEYIEAARKAGADSYVTKEKSNIELTEAIRQVYQGNKLFPNFYSAHIGEQLTAKEKEILTLIAADLTNIEISNELKISKRTAEYHISSIIRKLDADSRVGAVVNAIKQGLLNV